VQRQITNLQEGFLVPIGDVGAAGKCMILFALSHKRVSPSLPVERMYNVHKVEETFFFLREIE
jgi:hypothetical protein